VLVQTQLSRVRDDLGQMFIKRMMRIHRRGKEALALHHLKHQERTDGLIRTLRDVVAAYQTGGGADERLAVDRLAVDQRALSRLRYTDARVSDTARLAQLFLLALAGKTEGEKLAALAAFERARVASGLNLHDIADMLRPGKSPASSAPASSAEAEADVQELDVTFREAELFAASFPMTIGRRLRTGC